MLQQPAPPVSLPRRIGLFAALGALLSGCSVTDALDVLVARDSYQGQSGLAYGADPRQKLDVFKPVGAGAAGANANAIPNAVAPVVVFFYGGNWSRGARADYRFVGEALAASGAIAIVADYRLSPQVRWRDILADCAAATRWAFDHAAELGGDPRRVYLMGHSAGAYNAAMLALDERWLRAEALAPQRLAGWIGLAGPYDFLPITDPPSRVAFDWPDTPQGSQPIVHVSARAPRTLLLAAVKDDTVNPRRNTAGLAERLKAAGVDVQVKLFDNVNHVTVLGAVARPLKWLAPVLDEVLAFVGLTPRR